MGSVLPGHELHENLPLNCPDCGSLIKTFHGTRYRGIWYHEKTYVCGAKWSTTEMADGDIICERSCQNPSSIEYKRLVEYDSLDKII